MHDPVTHAELTHAVLLVHAPPEEHVSTLLFTQWVVPGEQTPVQLPPTQAWFEHAVPSTQVPVPSHVCGV
jgi:hypothetical protein